MMTTAAAAELRAFAASKDTVPVRGAVGDMWVTRTLDGVVIESADPLILVTVDLVESADGDVLTFAVEDDETNGRIGVLTFRAINRTMRYRVLGYNGAPQDVVVCEQIDDKA